MPHRFIRKSGLDGSGEIVLLTCFAPKALAYFAFDLSANISLVRPDWITGQPRNASMLWLDKNENLDPELARFVSGIIRTLGSEVASVYPDVGPLYQQLAASLGCGANQLMLTAGSDAAIASGMPRRRHCGSPWLIDRTAR